MPHEFYSLWSGPILEGTRTSFSAGGTYAAKKILWQVQVIIIPIPVSILFVYVCHIKIIRPDLLPIILALYVSASVVLWKRGVPENDRA